MSISNEPNAYGAGNALSENPSQKVSEENAQQKTNVDKEADNTQVDIGVLSEHPRLGQVRRRKKRSQSVLTPQRSHRPQKTRGSDPRHDVLGIGLAPAYRYLTETKAATGLNAKDLMWQDDQRSRADRRQHGRRAGRPKSLKARFSAWCRRTNDENLIWIERNPGWAALLSCTLFFTPPIVAALLSRDWGPNKAFGTAPTPQDPDSGQFYVEKGFLDARSGVHAANAFVGRGEFSPNNMSAAYDKRVEERRQDMEAGGKGDPLLREGSLRYGFSVETLKTALEDKGYETDIREVTFPDAPKTTTSFHSRAKSLIRELKFADRVTLKVSRTGRPGDGRWVTFRKYRDEHWALLDSATKFQDQIRGYHRVYHPAMYMWDEFQKGQVYIQAIVPSGKERALRDQQGVYAKDLAEELISDDRLGYSLYALDKLASDHKEPERKALEDVHEDLIRSEYINVSVDERKQRCNKLDSLAYRAANRRHFAKSNVIDLERLAIAYRTFCGLDCPENEEKLRQEEQFDDALYGSGPPIEKAIQEDVIVMYNEEGLVEPYPGIPKESLSEASHEMWSGDGRIASLLDLHPPNKETAPGPEAKPLALLHEQQKPPQVQQPISPPSPLVQEVAESSLDEDSHNSISALDQLTQSSEELPAPESPSAALPLDNPNLARGQESAQYSGISISAQKLDSSLGVGATSSSEVSSTVDEPAPDVYQLPVLPEAPSNLEEDKSQLPPDEPDLPDHRKGDRHRFYVLKALDKLEVLAKKAKFDLPSKFLDRAYRWVHRSNSGEALDNKSAREGLEFLRNDALDLMKKAEKLVEAGSKKHQHIIDLINVFYGSSSAASFDRNLGYVEAVRSTERSFAAVQSCVKKAGHEFVKLEDLNKAVETLKQNLPSQERDVATIKPDYAEDVIDQAIRVLSSIPQPSPNAVSEKESEAVRLELRNLCQWATFVKSQIWAPKITESIQIE